MLALLDLFFTLGLLSQHLYDRVLARIHRRRFANPAHLRDFLARLCRLDRARAARLLARTPAEILTLIERYRVVGELDNPDDPKRAAVLKDGNKCADLLRLARLLIGGNAALTPGEVLNLFTIAADDAFSRILVPIAESDPAATHQIAEKRRAAGLMSVHAALADALGRLTPWQARALLRGTPGELTLGDGVYLLEPCGRGGIGQVYRAFNARLGQERAVKVLRPDRRERLTPGQVEHWRARWLHEARTQHRLDRHPRVARVHGAGLDTASGETFIEMEFVAGLSLDQVVRQLAARGEQLSVAVVCRLGLQMLEAIGHAHAHGLIHRDCKPHNVMWRLDGGRLPTGPVPDDPDLVLIDFCFARRLRDDTGVAVLDPDDTWVGTPGYRAPELTAPGTASIRSDLFAFGRSLNYLLHGQATPLPGTERGGVPPALARLIKSLTANDPADRPADCAEAADFLHRALEQLTGRSTTVERRSFVDVPASGEWTEGESLGTQGRETALTAGDEREIVPGKVYSFAASPNQPEDCRPERIGVLLREQGLRRLSLERCLWATDDCLEKMFWDNFGAVKHEESGLWSLDLSSTPITDRGVRWVAQLRHLRSLSLRRCGVTEAGLEHLAELEELEELRLTGCRHLGAGTVRALADAVPWLRCLEVGGMAAGDDALADLSRLENLAQLRLMRSPARRLGLRALERCRSLRQVTFSGSVAFSDHDRDRLDAFLHRRGGTFVITGRHF